MGKKAQIQGDFDDVSALLEIIQVLKDVSTNRYFQFAQQKVDFSKFLDTFLIFFNTLGSVETECELVRNTNKVTDIVVITSEASFMSQLNSRVCAAAAREYQKNPGSKIICVGWRGVDKLKQLGMPTEKLYQNVEVPSRYETALRIRDFLIERITKGETGRAVVIYTWVKSFSVLKPRIIKLLPASELIGGDEPPEGEAGAPKESNIDHLKDIILESKVDGIMRVLADVWVSSRLYEILSDLKLAEAAAQSQQLESSIESLSKEKKGLALGLRKATRADLNKAMLEVFVSSSIVKRSGKRR
jgi:F0F1-type ATP synthase gamma subunit